MTVTVANRKMSNRKYYELSLLCKDIYNYLSTVPNSEINMKQIRKRIQDKTNYAGHLESGYCVMAILERMDGIKLYYKGQSKFYYHGKLKRFNRMGNLIE